MTVGGGVGKVCRVLLLVALAMWAGPAFAIPFIYGIARDGTTALPFHGNLAGAYAFVGADGMITLGPGSENISIGTVPSGVSLIRNTYSGRSIFGVPLLWMTRAGSQTFRADSAGVTVTGAAVVSGKGTYGDSLRANKGLQVGGEQITKIKKGSFTADFTNLTAGSTLDQAFTVSGLDVASQWVVSVSPNANMTSGVALGGARVSSDNTVTVRVINTCAAGVNPDPVTLYYVAIK